MQQEGSTHAQERLGTIAKFGERVWPAVECAAGMDECTADWRQVCLPGMLRMPTMPTLTKHNRWPRPYLAFF